MKTMDEILKGFYTGADDEFEESFYTKQEVISIMECVKIELCNDEDKVEADV